MERLIGSGGGVATGGWKPAQPPRPALLPGQPWPMGANVGKQGVNFCVFSTHATQVDLCLSFFV